VKPVVKPVVKPDVKPKDPGGTWDPNSPFLPGT